jgi:hypothetical protein
MHFAPPDEVRYGLDAMIWRLREVAPDFLPDKYESARRKVQRVLDTPIGACFTVQSYGGTYGRAVRWTVASVDALPANYATYISAVRSAAKRGEVVTVTSASAIHRAA